MGLACHPLAFNIRADLRRHRVIALWDAAGQARTGLTQSKP